MRNFRFGGALKTIVELLLSRAHSHWLDSLSLPLKENKQQRRCVVCVLLFNATKLCHCRWERKKNTRQPALHKQSEEVSREFAEVKKTKARCSKRKRTCTARISSRCDFAGNYYLPVYGKWASARRINSGRSGNTFLPDEISACCEWERERSGKELTDVQVLAAEGADCC